VKKLTMPCSTCITKAICLNKKVVECDILADWVRSSSNITEHNRLSFCCLGKCTCQKIIKISFLNLIRLSVGRDNSRVTCEICAGKSQPFILTNLKNYYNIFQVRHRNEI
jgi:hypothetical protein